jgi:hypothetical protein
MANLNFGQYCTIWQSGKCQNWVEVLDDKSSRDMFNILFTNSKNVDGFGAMWFQSKINI